MPTLPLELCEYIIDDLQDSVQDLNSCSLVCRNWLPRTRSHLFRFLRLSLGSVRELFLSRSASNYEPGACRWRNALIGEPDVDFTHRQWELLQQTKDELYRSIAPLVRDLHMFAMGWHWIFPNHVSSPSPTNQVARSMADVFELLGHFTNLEKLSIHFSNSFEFSDYNENVPEEITARTPVVSLDRLYFHYSQFSTSLELLRALRACCMLFPSMRMLSLDHIALGGGQWNDEKFSSIMQLDTSSGIRARPLLQELKMAWITLPELEKLLSPLFLSPDSLYCLQNLRHLEIGNSNLELWEPVIVRYGQTIQFLKIEISSLGDVEIDIFPFLPSLTHLTLAVLSLQRRRSTSFPIFRKLLPEQVVPFLSQLTIDCQNAVVSFDIWREILNRDFDEELTSLFLRKGQKESVVEVDKPERMDAEEVRIRGLQQVEIRSSISRAHELDCRSYLPEACRAGRVKLVTLG